MDSKDNSEDIEKRLEREMLEDVDVIYQHYRDMLSKGKTSISALNTVIRALKAAHRYFSDEELDESNETRKEL